MSAAPETNWIHRLVDMTALRLLLWLVLAGWFLFPWLEAPHNIGSAHDWTYFTHHATSSFRTWVDYHQIPIWDAYYCGGIPALGNLQNNAVSPSFLWSIVFGVGAGLRFAWLALFVLGLEGTYRYVHHLGVRGLGALTAPVVFAFSGRFVLPFLDGQPVFLGFLLFPWVVLGYEKGLRSIRWAVVGGAFMAWVFLDGGAVPTPMMAVVLAFLVAYHTVALWLSPERGIAWYRPAATLAIMGAVTVGLTAFRFIPVVVYVLGSPREWLGEESYSFLHVLHMLFTPDPNGGYSGPGTAYVGAWAGVLFVLGTARLDRRGLQLLTMLAVTFVLTMGFSGIGVYELVKSIPVFENLRNPFRYSYFVAFFLAVGAGRGIDTIERLISGHDGFRRRLTLLRIPAGVARLVVAALATAIVAGLAYETASQTARFNAPRLEGVAVTEPAMILDQPFRQSVGNRWASHVWPAANLGTIGCFEEQPFFTSGALRGDLEQEEYLLEPDAGQVRRADWSPHRIELDVELERTAVILVNQNANESWRTSHGRIVEHEGLLAVEAPAGSYRLVIRFVDWRVRLGAGISLATAVVLLGFGFLSWRRRRAARGGDNDADSPAEGVAPTPTDAV